jgi:hypothetical protein
MTRAAVGAVGIKEATMRTVIPAFVGFTKAPWNKGRLIGQKRPLKPREVWAIRTGLTISPEDVASRVAAGEQAVQQNQAIRQLIASLNQAGGTAVADIAPPRRSR